MWKKILCAFVFSYMGHALAGPFDPIISKAWIGETIPDQTTATLQLNLMTVKTVTLISAYSPIAESIEIHGLQRVKGGMKIQVLNNLPLQDHSTTIFGANGLFLMMTGLKQSLQIGDQVPISLAFEFSDKKKKVIDAVAEVKKMDLSYKHYSPKHVYDHR